MKKLFIVLLATFTLAACSNRQALYNAEGMTIPADLSQQQVEKAIVNRDQL